MNDSLFLQCLQGVHPLFLCEQSLFAIVFNVHDPFKIESVLQWMLLMRSKVSHKTNSKDSVHVSVTDFQRKTVDLILLFGKMPSHIFYRIVGHYYY